jgi:hypothetical protein
MVLTLEREEDEISPIIGKSQRNEKINPAIRKSL